MMAGSLAKRIVNNHVRDLALPSLSFSLSPRRRLHHEKQVDMKDMSSSRKPEEYWEPDPDTGVFIPANEHRSEEPVVTCTTEDTVLDEKTFFRRQEDLETHPHRSFTGEMPPVDPFAEDG